MALSEVVWGGGGKGVSGQRVSYTVEIVNPTEAL